MSHQPSLFSAAELSGTYIADRVQPHTMSAEALSLWKTQIANFQQAARFNPPIEQTTLFETAPAHTDPQRIDPFILEPQSLAFWRLPVDSPGEACLYFVIDHAASLLLYVGETCRSNQRWKGEHDCKRYIKNYQALHFQHGLVAMVNIGFWWEAPIAPRPRQQLESALISKWRSPFNKENWDFWGTPFIGSK
jgi:hypothetical protein